MQWYYVVDDHLQRGAEEDGSESNVQEEFEEKLRMYIDGLTQKRCVSLSDSHTDYGIEVQLKLSSLEVLVSEP